MPTATYTPGAVTKGSTSSDWALAWDPAWYDNLEDPTHVTGTASAAATTLHLQYGRSWTGSGGPATPTTPMWITAIKAKLTWSWAYPCHTPGNNDYSSLTFWGGGHTIDHETTSSLTETIEVDLGISGEITEETLIDVVLENTSMFTYSFVWGGAPACDITITISSISVVVVYSLTNPETGAPRVDAGDDTTAHGPAPATVALDGAVHGDTELVAPYDTYQWTQISGPYTAVISTPTALATNVILDHYAPGAFVFRLTVSASASPITPPIQDDVTITIPVDVGPIVSSSTQQVVYPDVAHLTATVEDAGWHGPLQYFWEQVDGPAATIVSPRTLATDVVFPETQATYKFRLTVSNDLEVLLMGYRIIYPLGGSRHDGVLGTSPRPVLDYQAIALDGTSMSGVVVNLKAAVRTKDAATAVTPKLYRDPVISGGVLTGGTVVVTGDACSATSEDYDGTNQQQTKAVALASGVHTYLLASEAANALHPVLGFGHLELYVP